MRDHVILMTGATGAVGRPLLAELLRRDDVERVVALQHVDSVPRCERVEIVAGDVTARNFALSHAEAARLTSEVTAIIHAAADTRFLAPEGQTTANVTGTFNVLAFAARCPRLDRVVALSTTHVAGRRSGVILEEQLEHAEGFVNQYEASKYAAELELRQWMVDLPVSVCRISTVIGDSTTGAIARHGAIHHAVRLLYAGLAPMIPGREDSPVDFLASDYVARAIATLSTTGFEPGRTWHLCAGSDTIPASDLLDLTMESFVKYRPSWRRRTIECPAVVELETFELFCRSADQAGNPTLRAAAAVMAAFAPQLAYPKRFDDRHCRVVLLKNGITAPPVRDTWTRVVRHLVAANA